MKISEIAAAVRPFVVGWIGEIGGSAGTGGYAPSPHDLSSAHHTGTLADAQAPNFLLRDGSRSLLGNLGVADAVTIDGVDVSVFKGTYDTHAAATAAAGHTGIGAHTHQNAGEGGQLDHGAALTGLGDDDHAQYLLASTAAGAGLTVASRVLAVGAGTMITVNTDDVAIAAGANYQFIGTGAGAAAGWRDVSELAGAGLTTSAGVLAVGAGNGITVNADDVAVKLKTTSGLEVDANGLALADSVAGNGLTITNKVLAVGVSGLGLSTTPDAVTLTSSSSPGAAASVLATNDAGSLQLVSLGVGTAAGTYVLNTDGRSKIGMTDTSYATARPVALATTFFAAPSSAPSQLTDYHGIDCVLQTSGANLNSNVSLYTFEANASHNTSATINRLVASYCLSELRQGSAAEGIGLRVLVRNLGSGTLTTGKAIWVDAPVNSGGGTFSQFHAIDVSDPGANNYALYMAGGLNYLAGSLRIGYNVDTTCSNALLVSVANASTTLTDKSGTVYLYNSSTTADSYTAILFHSAYGGSGIANPRGKIALRSTAMGSSLHFLVSNNYGAPAGINVLTLDYQGRVGINTAGPDRRLDVLDASNPQLRLTHTDGTAYAEMQATASGYLYFSATGSRYGFGNVSPAYTVDITGTLHATQDVTLDNNLSVSADLTFVGASSIKTTAGGDLTIQPNDDLVLDPDGGDVLLTLPTSISADNWVSGLTGWGVSYVGAGDFRSLTADELHVKAFIADIYMALVGGIVVTKSRARVSRDFTIPSNGNTGTLYLEDLEGWPDVAVFATSDAVRLRYVNTSGGGLVVTDVWGTVSAYSDLTGGEQSWTFTTTSDGGVSGNKIYKGAIVLDYGQTSSGSRGLWEATVLDTAGAPYSQVATWETNPWTAGNWTARVRLGNLDGISGVGLEYGLWAGQNTTTKYLLLTDSHFEVHGLDLKLYDGASNTIRLDPTTPSLAMGATIPTGYMTNDGLWAGKDTSYKFRVGSVSGGALVKGIAWDGTSLNVKGNLVLGPGQGFILDNALLHCKFDGPRPFEADFQVDTTGHLGQKATTSGGIIGRPGKFGKAVQVAEATTNIMRNPSTEVDTSYWVPLSGATLTRSSEQVYIGSYALKVEATSTQYSGTNQNTASGLGGSSQTYSAQARVYVTSGQCYCWMRFVYTDASSTEAGYTIFSPASEWQTWTVSATSSATKTLDYIQLFFRQPQIGIAAMYYVDAVQLENKTYTTPYCDGSLGTGHSWSGAAHASTSSRTTALLSYANPLKTVAGSVSLWWKPATDNTGPNMVLFTDDVDLLVYFESADDKIYFIATNWSVSTAALTFQAEIWMHLAFVWSSSGVAIYKDGALAASGSFTESSFVSPLYIGCSSSGSQIDGMLDDLVMLDRALSADEVAQLYQSGAPVTVSSNPFELMLTGYGNGKVWGHAGGLFGMDASGNESFAIANEATVWGARYSGGAQLAAGDFVLGDPDLRHLFYDASAGTLVVGDPGNENVYLSGTALQFRNSTTVYAQLDGAALTMGQTSDNHVSITAGHVQLKNGATVYTDLAAGVLTVGDTANEYVKVSTSGVQIYDGATLLATYAASTTLYDIGGADRLVLSTTGITVGDSTEGEYATIDATNGIRLYGNAALTVQIKNDGDALFGQEVVSKFNLMWDASEGDLLLRSNTTAYFQVDGSASLMKFGSNVSAVATTAIAILGADQTYNSESLGAGDLLIGDNSASKANVLWDKSAGKLQFRGGTTMQCEIGTTGQLLAGGGNVLLDSNGIVISTTTEVADVRSYQMKDGGTSLIGRLGAYRTGGLVSVQALSYGRNVTEDARLELYADCSTGHSAKVRLQATSNATVGYVDLEVKDSPSIARLTVTGVSLLVARGIYIGGTIANPPAGAIQMPEISDPGVAPADEVRLYCRDNGSGKSQLCAVFSSGAVQVLATQP